MCCWDIIPVEQEGSLSFLGLIPKILSLIVYHTNSEKSLFGTGQGGSFIYNPPPHSHALPLQRSRKLFINTIWWTCTHLQPKTQNKEKNKKVIPVCFSLTQAVLFHFGFWPPPPPLTAKYPEVIGSEKKMSLENRCILCHSGTRKLISSTGLDENHCYYLSLKQNNSVLIWKLTRWLPPFATQIWIGLYYCAYIEKINK